MNTAFLSEETIDTLRAPLLASRRVIVFCAQCAAGPIAVFGEFTSIASNALSIGNVVVLPWIVTPDTYVGGDSTPKIRGDIRVSLGTTVAACEAVG